MTYIEGKGIILNNTITIISHRLTRVITLHIYIYIYDQDIRQRKKKRSLYIKFALQFLKRLEILLLDVYVTFTQLFILEHRKKILGMMPNTGAPLKTFVN